MYAPYGTTGAGLHAFELTFLSTKSAATEGVTVTGSLPWRWPLQAPQQVKRLFVIKASWAVTPSVQPRV